MPPEHADMEADWLASELKRAAEYARKAYQPKDDAERQLYLANLIGTLDSLYTHYKIGAPVEYEGEQAQVLPTATHRSFEHRDRRGWFARMFLGND